VQAARFWVAFLLLQAVQPRCHLVQQRRWKLCVPPLIAGVISPYRSLSRWMGFERYRLIALTCSFLRLYF
jgi:hypothetical protein